MAGHPRESRGTISFSCVSKNGLTFGLNLLTSKVKYTLAVALGIGFLLVGTLHFTA